MQLAKLDKFFELNTRLVWVLKYRKLAAVNQWYRDQKLFGYILLIRNRCILNFLCPSLVVKIKSTYHHDLVNSNNSFRCWTSNNLWTERWYNIKLDERVCSIGYLEHTTELIMLRNVQSYFNWGKYHIPIHVEYTSPNVINILNLCRLPCSLAKGLRSLCDSSRESVYDSHWDSPKITERALLAKMVDNKLHKMKI